MQQTIIPGEEKTDSPANSLEQQEHGQPSATSSEKERPSATSSTARERPSTTSTARERSSNTTAQTGTGRGNSKEKNKKIVSLEEILRGLTKRYKRSMKNRKNDTLNAKNHIESFYNNK